MWRLILLACALVAVGCANDCPECVVGGLADGLVRCPDGLYPECPEPRDAPRCLDGEPWCPPGWDGEPAEPRCVPIE